MNFEKKNNIYKGAMIIIVTALVTFLLTAVALNNYYGESKIGLINSNKSNKLENKIKILKTYLEESYLGEIPNEEELEEAAIKGYVEGLGDPYTEYLTKDEYEELIIDVNGNYVGIGIYMAMDRYENIVVLKPIEGSPAEAADIRPGDIITKVNGEDCKGMDLSIVANKVKGEEGTTVDLEIMRGTEKLTKNIERKTVKISHIESKVLDKNIGNIQILTFDDKCSEEFKNKLEELKSKNIKSLIIDVRDNGGGIVSEAVNISELFLPKDKIIMNEIGINNKENQTVSKEKNIINEDMEIVILANENTASAAEIFIAALKDNNVAKVIGKRTFGKGVMQEIVPLSLGGALKVTIKEFKTPNNETINKVGIEPNIEVTEIENNSVDEQLEKAIEELTK